jgi:hypothetical protein
MPKNGGYTSLEPAIATQYEAICFRQSYFSHKELTTFDASLKMLSH